MFGYTTTLRQLTQGKGEWTMEFSRYTRLSDETRDQVINDWKEANGIEVETKKRKK
jgi:elongation factor G